MENGEKTKYRLAEAIRELMHHSDLEKITVKEIVALSGLTRQTFYRNFRDKYDLVNWYFEKLAEKSFLQMGDSCTLREGLTKKFLFIREEKAFFSQAFRCEGTNSVLEYDYMRIMKFYSDMIVSETGRPLDKDTQFVLELYCSGSIFKTKQWADRGMREEPEKMADMLILALPPLLRELLGKLL